MKVLLLGYAASPVNMMMQRAGDEVIATSAKIDEKFLDVYKPEFLVSHGYGFILKENILSRFPCKAINLHPSWLPWNRGSDPDFWSLFDDTPKGVSIHYMSPVIDGGDIIAREAVGVEEGDTLRTYYDRLREVMCGLFGKNWKAIRSGECGSFQQESGGSYHRAVDKEPFMGLLEDGFDTPVGKIMEYGRGWRLGKVSGGKK